MPISFDWSEKISALPSNPIPAEWLATKGKGVKVAYIDTGANLGTPSLNHLNIPGHKFYTGAPNFSVAKLTGQDLVQDSFPQTGHGTKYLSLLAGKKPATDSDADVVVGFANEAEYFIIKARDKNDVDTTVRNLLNAIELSANLGIEVAIIGLCISAQKIVNELNMSQAEVNRVFNLPGVKKMNIFTALENRSTGDPWDDIATQMFPTLRPEVINVARFPNDYDQLATIIRPQPIAYLIAGFEDWSVLTKIGNAEAMIDADEHEASTNLGMFKVFSNSCAVAIAGGLGTLALSYFKAQNGGASPSKTQLLTLLNTAFQPLEDSSVVAEKPAFFTNINPANV